MKPKSIVILVAMAMILILVAACGQQAEPEPTVISDAVQQPEVVSAEAFVVPLQEANLAFEVGGRVVSVAVEEGDNVEPGQVLIELDSSAQQAALAEAEAGLGQAKAASAESESRLAEAAAGLATAQANLAKVKADPTDEEVAQFQANLSKTEAALAQLVAGPTPEDIAQAKALVQTAQAQLNELLADPREEDLQIAASNLLQAQADVRKAQSDYDRVRYGNPPDTLVVGGELEKATLRFEAAQAQHDKLVNGATKEQVATAQARVGEAEAALNKVLAGATAERIAQAQADVAKAQADLDRLLAGATDEDIAIAEAGVEKASAGVETARASVDLSQAGVGQAESRLDSAQVAIDKTELTAPFAATVGNLNVDTGEIVQPGAPVMSLGDASGWQIETDDLTEIDVVNVQIGAKVNISVDALPGETLEGKVVRVTPKSETKAGDVTYTVLIDITSGDTSRLRWGMTTFVDIEADSGIAR